MLLIVDLDGVVYRGAVPVPGVAQVLRERAAAGDAVVYATNNSRRHRSEYLSHLTDLELPVSENQIVTSARATALALTELVAPGAGGDAGGIDRDGGPVMVFGAAGLARELTDVGFTVVGTNDEGLAAHPWALVVGLDTELSHQRLSVAGDAVRAGARFVATNRDPLFPTPSGYVAGAGAIVAAVAVVAGRGPDLVVGKPEPGLFLEAARVAGLPAEEAVVVGDSLVTDIVAADAVGARSVLMLTGVTTRAQLDAAPPERRPTEVAADAEELRAALKRLAHA